VAGDTILADGPHLGQGVAVHLVDDPIVLTEGVLGGPYVPRAVDQGGVGVDVEREVTLERVGQLRRGHRPDEATHRPS
jgi:hypothetical protein